MKIAFPSKRLLENLTPTLILCLVTVISHWEWFNPYSTLTSGDWYYWHDEPVAELLTSWGPWLSFWGTGNVNPQIPFLSFKWIWSLIINLGGNFDLAVKLTFLWPIAIFGFFSPYWLSRNSGCSRWEAFSLSLLYGSTTYFLIKQTSHLPIAFIYALAPLVITLTFRSVHKFDFLNLLILALVISFLIGVEVRCTFLLLITLMITTLPQNYKFSYFWFQMLILGVLIFLMNSFWLLPVIWSDSVVSAITSVTSRPLFGDHLFSILHGILLHESSWTGGYANQDFVTQLPRIWDFLPLSVMLLVTIRCSYRFKIDDERNILKVIFFSIWLLGVFLTKQTNPPFGWVYLWAYENLPVFNLYREASKFYMLTAIGMLGFLTYGLVRSLKLTSVTLTIALIIFSLVNLKPAITTDLDTLFVQRHIPNDYLILKKFLRDDRDSFRVLWVPMYSRWSYFDKMRSSMSFVSYIQGEDWEEISNLSRHGNWFLALRESINSGLHEKILAASVKYIVVPLWDSKDEDIYKYFKGTPKQWSQILDQAAYLKRLQGNFGSLAVYRLEDWKPRAYVVDNIMSQTPIEIRNPFSGFFRLKISDLKKNTSTKVNFSEKNDGNWIACLKTDYLLLLIYGCPNKDQLDVSLNSYNHISVILPSNNLAEAEIDIIHQSVRWFWIGLILSILTVTLVLLAILILIIRRISKKINTFEGNSN